MNKSISLLAALFVLASAGHAQRAFQQFAIGIEAGTYAPGITLSTSLSPCFKLRAGWNMMDIKWQGSHDFEPEVVNSLPEPNVTLSATLTNPELSFANAKLIVDYYPVKDGLFSVSAGLYAGKNSVAVDGRINGYTEMDAVFELGDIIVKPNSDGTFSGVLKSGNAVKPYLGVGVGRTIANSRIGFKCDLGVVYQGDYGFESKNILSGGNHVIKKATKLGSAEWLLNVYPLINFQLSCRIF